MNPKTRLPLAVVLVLAVLAACTGSPRLKVYKATAITVHSVHVAMLAANDAYQAGVFDDTDRSRILDVYAKYQAGIKTAIDAGRLVTTPGDEVVLEGEIAQLAADVVSLIESLRVQKDTPSGTLRHGQVRR